MAQGQIPLLIFPKTVQSAVQQEAMRVNEGTGHEVMAFLFLKRVWQNGRVVYQPTGSFVPRGKDYEQQYEDAAQPSLATSKALYQHVQRTGTHLLWGHTHPPESKIDFSEADIQSYRDLAINLGMLPGGRCLVAAVFDHFMSRRAATYAHWRGDKRSSIEVLYPDKSIRLTGCGFTEVGSEVYGYHRCPRTRWVSDEFRAASGLLPGKWTGRLLPSPRQPERVLEDTPGDQVLIQVTGWPLECDCYLRQRVKRPIMLAELGYFNSHPWRSG